MQRLVSRKGSPRPVELDDASTIGAEDSAYCVYPLNDLLTALGRKWALLLAAPGNARRRFHEIQGDLPVVSSRTLTDRLRELEALGLVRRDAYDESPPRVEYALSGTGRELRTLLLPLLAWAQEREVRDPG